MFTDKTLAFIGAGVMGEAMIRGLVTQDAGVHMGFPRRVAETLVIQTIRGSVDHEVGSGKHVAELRNQVTSPGGTTAVALYHMEEGGVGTVVSRGIWSACQRSIEMGKGE